MNDIEFSDSLEKYLDQIYHRRIEAQDEINEFEKLIELLKQDILKLKSTLQVKEELLNLTENKLIQELEDFHLEFN